MCLKWWKKNIGECSVTKGGTEYPNLILKSTICKAISRLIDDTEIHRWYLGR